VEATGWHERCYSPSDVAAIDTMLRVISERGAEALTIATDAVPELRKGGAVTPLSMPPLPATLVDTFVEEIGGRDARSYVCSTGAYSVRVDVDGSSTRLTFAPRAAAAPEPSPAAPVAVSAAPVRPAEPAPATSTAGPARVESAALVELLELADERGASDIVLSSGVDAWLRVDGRMQSVGNTAMSEAALLAALNVDPAILGEHGSADFALVHGRRYRVNVFRQLRGIGAALRPIRTEVPTLATLHLPRALHELVGYANGLVLVAGMAGSGKSTTLAALVEHLNSTQTRHVITLEDPIEYQYQSRRCLIHQREIGTHVADFATGLRAALRETPDLILVGELRDRETIAAAVTAAETGHLVIGTIHASSAMVAVDRMLDVFPSEQQSQVRYQLSMTLRATLTQHLLDSPMPPGRTPAIELMKVNHAVASHIRDSKTYQIPSAIQTGRAAGMMSLELSLAQLVQEGIVERSVAEAVAVEPDYFRQLLSSRRKGR